MISIAPCEAVAQAYGVDLRAKGVACVSRAKRDDPKLGKLELFELTVPAASTNDKFPQPGYALELVVQTAHVVRAARWSFSILGGLNKRVSCRRKLARFVPLPKSSGADAFGIEIDTEVQTTYFDKPPVTYPAELENTRVVCAPGEDGIACKSVSFGGRENECRALRWTRDGIDYTCAGQAAHVALGR